MSGASPWASARASDSSVVVGNVALALIASRAASAVAGKTDPTYSSAVNVVAVASATDIATITGSATKTVYITKVIVSGIQTAAALSEVLLIKRSAANTGGTSTAGTALPHDSADAAATATVLAYTANPTVGAAVATLRRAYAPVAAAASVVNPVVQFALGEHGKPLVLRGIAETLAVNLNGITLLGGVFNVAFEWYEA